MCGDVETAREFSDLHLDKIIFTGSPAVGKTGRRGRRREPRARNAGAGREEEPRRRRPPDADLELAAHRIAGTRMLNGRQVCLCPDYVFAPRSGAEELTAALQAELAGLSPTYTDNPAAVPIVNKRNLDPRPRR